MSRANKAPAPDAVEERQRTVLDSLVYNEANYRLAEACAVVECIAEVAEGSNVPGCTITEALNGVAVLLRGVSAELGRAEHMALATEA